MRSVDRGGNRYPNKRIKRHDDRKDGDVKGKPDMDRETWMKLNGYYPEKMHFYLNRALLIQMTCSGKILGTNISLDTPEDVEAWIKERKAKWPTAERVKQKVRITL